MHSIPIGGNDYTNLHVDPWADIPLPTKGPGGSKGPLMPIKFPTVLWHELVGHGGIWEAGGDPHHPQNDWNLYDSEDPMTDPVIDIENEYRRWIGIDELYGKYWRSTEKWNTKNKICCPE